jgi:ABC-type sugar transport system ATPase subunit
VAGALSHQRRVCRSGKNVSRYQGIFDELDIDIDPRARVGTLSVSQMQMIEIAKAFSYDAKIVIMDEPTSSLTEKEVNHLFKIIRKLKERGCGIVYISHKMEEIFQLCDEITILRDGQWIATQPLEGLDMDKIIAMMVGRSLTQRFPEKHNTPGETILEVRNLTSLRQPSIRDVSFDLRKGRSSVSPGWWERSVPILSKPFSASAKNQAARLRCTARRSITIARMKPLTTVLR